MPSISSPYFISSLLGGPAIAALSLGISTALADVDEPGAQQEEDAPVDRVVVTAQRRAEDIQRVPLNVSSISDEDLDQRQISRMDDLQAEIPNIIIEPNTGTSSGAKVFLRGIGADESLFTADPAVAIYIDDVYIPRATGALMALYDLERIEVLRGPQGTLYGRNATGGAVRYITRKPGGEPMLRFDTRIGNLGRLDARMSLSADLSETVSVQLAALTRNRDGYMRDITNNRDVNDEGISAVRASLLWRDGDHSVNLAVDALRERNSAVFATGVIRDPIERPGDLPPRPVNDPDRNYYTLETNLVDDINDLDQFGLSLVTESAFQTFDWRNILAYRQMENTLFGDFDGTPETRFHLFQDQDQDQWSYESQLISSTSGPLSWVLGFFYFSESNDQPTRQDIFAPGPTNVIAQDTDAWAVYGQTSYDLTERMSLTGGLRYSWEEKDVDIVSTLASGEPNFTFADKNDWDNIDWRLALDYQFSDEFYGFVSAATGFKSGAFNGRGTSPALVTTVEEEKVTSYEAGLKSTLMSGRLLVNATYFFNNYDDLQLTAINPDGAFVLLNAADTEIHGLELEVSARPTPKLRVYGNLGTINAEYTGFAEVNRPLFEGRDLKQAPDLTYGIGFDYTTPISNGELVASSQWSWTDSHYQNVDNSEIIKTDAYGLLNARLDYRPAAGNWSVGVYAQNLLDEEYFTGGFDIAGIGVAVAYMNLPRQYGVNFMYRFW